jgi:hypothetical protein
MSLVSLKESEMRFVAMWSFVLFMVAAVGCGGGGYQDRQAPPGEASADPAAVSNELNSTSDAAPKPATP